MQAVNFLGFFNFRCCCIYDINASKTHHDGEVEESRPAKVAELEIGNLDIQFQIALTETNNPSKESPSPSSRKPSKHEEAVKRASQNNEESTQPQDPTYSSTTQYSSSREPEKNYQSGKISLSTDPSNGLSESTKSGTK